ncbi:MAG: hypothetical protein AB7F64_08570 [Gammaproteobacteria bacterium]
MSNRNYRINVCFTKEDYQLLNAESVSRNTNLAETIRDCLGEYLSLREELATAIEQPRKLGAPHSGKIIHVLLARSEERIAASLDRIDHAIAELNEKNALLRMMIDQFYFDLMQYLPEIPLELLATAKTRATTRHRKWRDKFRKDLF